MTENDASTPSEECKAIIKKTGKKCTMTAKYGDFCGVHKPRPNAAPKPKTTPKSKAVPKPRAHRSPQASNVAALEISLLAASVIEALSNTNPLIPATKTKAEIEQLLKALASSKPGNDIESQKVKNATTVLAKVLSQFDPPINEDGGAALAGSTDNAVNQNDPAASGESKSKDDNNISADQTVIDLKKKKDGKKGKKDKDKPKSSKDKNSKKDKKNSGGKKKKK